MPGTLKGGGRSLRYDQWLHKQLREQRAAILKEVRLQSEGAEGDIIDNRLDPETAKSNLCKWLRHSKNGLDVQLVVELCNKDGIIDGVLRNTFNRKDELVIRDIVYVMSMTPPVRAVAQHGVDMYA